MWYTDQHMIRILHISSEEKKPRVSYHFPCLYCCLLNYAFCCTIRVVTGSGESVPFLVSETNPFIVFWSVFSTTIPTQKFPFVRRSTCCLSRKVCLSLRTNDTRFPSSDVTSQSQCPLMSQPSLLRSFSSTPLERIPRNICCLR